MSMAWGAAVPGVERLLRSLAETGGVQRLLQNNEQRTRPLSSKRCAAAAARGRRRSSRSGVETSREGGRATRKRKVCCYFGE